jgi:hypothetical protein
MNKHVNKIKSMPIKWDSNLPYGHNLANTINNYWGCEVAWPQGNNARHEGNVYSNMTYGCPNVKEMPGYKHPAIAWMHIDEKGRWIVTSG